MVENVAQLGREEALFIGRSEASLRVRRQILRAAALDSPVLITGESGVGKRLVAREIHHRSLRRGQPFLSLHCDTIPESLIEGELFGHESEPGSSTPGDSPGSLELAEGGTLFLDEVGDLSLGVQPALLRAMDTGETRRVGGTVKRRVDLRVVAASSHNLKKMCAGGRFSEDLFYRLALFHIDVPPLRERVEDVPLLAMHFVDVISKRTGNKPVRIPPGAMARLKEHHWPGNARELSNVIRRAIAANSTAELDQEAIDLDPLSNDELNGLLDHQWRTARGGFETAYARRQLAKHRGDARRAARAAGLALGSFYRMLRRVGLRPGNR